MNYPSIRIEGAILSPDIIERIEDSRGQRPVDFNLDSAVKVKDEIAHAWADAQDYWRIFQRKLGTLKANSPATTETRQQWMVPLLGLLGYQLEYQPKVAELNGKTYNISHRATNRAQAPVQIVGYREPAGLDRKPELSNLRMSAHAVVQEFLNLNDQLYGLVTNGRVLRLLRDSSRLIKLSYLEFDLDRIFTDGLFTDFAILYRLLHVTRLPATNEAAADSWIERYHQDTIEQGTRIREGLRTAVTESLEILGTGFISHSENQALREQLNEGTLQSTVFFNHLLRLIYRLLFLNVVEERGLVFPKGTPPAQTRIYFDFYSVQRLRRMARTRGLKIERHHDAWLSLLSTFQFFERPEQAAKLGTTAFGGQLFDPQSLGPLSTCSLSNAALFHALDRLCSFDDAKTNQRLPVNFGALATEEFGSVYESLLELHPVIEMIPSPRFSLGHAGGNERKTSGSYYTSASLVDCLLDSALDSLIDAHIRDYEVLGYPSAEAAVLSLKVCDPACGSGHFLIAAAQRIARRLALLRAGDNEPSPDQLRHALREVISRCIYAVDINPMSVELCRVALWLEGVEPGKPLSFLDHHIQCGNSLLGTTPALLKRGISDDAFKSIDGDDGAVCSELKRRNRDERRGQGMLAFGQPSWLKLGNLVQSFANLAAQDDSTPQTLAAKEQQFVDLVRSTPYENAQLVADAWCAAFVCPKRSNSALEVTEALFRRWEDNPHHITPAEKSELLKLREQYRFFHWHLAFPEVFKPKPDEQIADDDPTGWSGGFDLMLGNPPWDTLSPDAKEFFSTYNPQVRFEDKVGQQLIIDNLLADQVIRGRWEGYCRDLYALVHFLKNSGRFRLYAPGNLGKGDFNVFRMFVETSLDLCADGRWAAQIVPEGLYNGANCMAIRQEIFNHFTLTRLLCFVNTREVWFKSVDTRAKFCLYTAQKSGHTESFPAAFSIDSQAALSDAVSGVAIIIPVKMIREFSPDALAVAELSSQMEIDIASKMYDRCPKFADESAGPPKRIYMREIDMGNDRELFDELPDGLPLYEGRMVDHYDHRAKGYRSGRGRKSDWEELPFDRTDKSIQPQWRIPVVQIPEKTRSRVAQYRVGFCDVASPTNERSLVAAMIPPGCICGDKVPTILFGEHGEVWECLAWLSVANTFVMDFVARTKISLKMSYTVLDSLPFPRFSPSDPIARALVTRALLLTCTCPEMNDLWDRMAADKWVPPRSPTNLVPGVTAEVRRLRLVAEIEVIVAREIYGLTREQLSYILDTFTIVEKKDMRAYGHFRTKDTILTIYDKMAKVDEATSVGAGLAVSSELFTELTVDTTTRATIIEPIPILEAVELLVAILDELAPVRVQQIAAERMFILAVNRHARELFEQGKSSASTVISKPGEPFRVLWKAVVTLGYASITESGLVERTDQDITLTNVGYTTMAKDAVALFKKGEAMKRAWPVEVDNDNYVIS